MKVTWTRDAGGTTAQLMLKDPAAWQPEPEEPKKSTGSGSSTNWDLYVKQAEKAKEEGRKAQEVMA